MLGLLDEKPDSKALSGFPHMGISIPLREIPPIFASSDARSEVQNGR